MAKKRRKKKASRKVRVGGYMRRKKRGSKKRVRVSGYSRRK